MTGVTDSHLRLLDMYRQGRYLDPPRGGFSRSLAIQDELRTLAEHGYVAVERDDWARGAITVTVMDDAQARLVAAEREIKRLRNELLEAEETRNHWVRVIGRKALR